MAPAKSTKTKARTSPTKKAVSPVPSSSPEIAAEDVEQQKFSASLASLIKAGSKRQAPISSDSEVEIIETPTKNKKVKIAQRPSPGSPEFESLPPVTIVNKTWKQAASKVARKLSFSSPGPVENGSESETELASPVDVKGKGKRVKKPSAKAKYMHDIAQNAASEDDDHTPPPAGKEFLKWLKNTPPLPAGVLLPDAQISAGDVMDDDAISVGYDASANQAAAESDDDRARHVKKKKPSAQVKRKNRNKSKHHSESPANDSEDVPLADLSKKKVHPHSSKAESRAADSDDGVQVLPAQNENPTAFKIEPCHLEPFVTLIKEAQQRGEITARDSTMPLYEVIIELLDGISARNFECAYNFSNSGLFVNPGRAALDGVGVKENRIVVAGGRTSIIFLSNGCVAASNLIIPGTSGSGMNMHRVKKIGIWPVNEEFDATTGYFGAIYGVSQFYCHFFGDILTFQTQKEKDASSNRPGSSTFLQTAGTPKKSSALFGARTPVKSRPASTQSFPPFLKFDEKVPIYDIRKTKFSFTAKELASLSSLPLYRNGISDLPQNSAVTVAYTVSTYGYNQADAPSNSLALSLNIQFVLLHGYVVPPPSDS